jgi:hypothetical protein
MLSEAVLNRKFPRIILSKEEFKSEYIAGVTEEFIKQYNFNKDEAKHFIYTGQISNNAYSSRDESINILFGDKLIDVTDASDILNISVLGKTVKKYYVCAPKNVINKPN